MKSNWIKSNKNLLIAVFSVLIYFGLTFAIGDSSTIYKQLLVPIGAILFIGIAWKGRSSKLIFYSSIIIFGLLHVANFTPLLWEAIPFYVLLIIPQLFMGLILGYVRIRMSFFYAILLHILINSPAALTILLFS